MNLDKILQTGNEVRIKREHDIFTTLVDEVTGDNTFTITPPFKHGERIAMKTGELYTISCVTERGIYTFESIVTEVDDSTNVQVVHLKINGEVRRLQRRQAFRVRENITVNARKKSDGSEPDGKWVKTNTVDIAELGLLLRFDEDCKDGQDIEMSLRINLFGINEIIPKVKGKVVRCIPTKNKEFGFLLGIQFEDLPEKARDALIKLVVLSQRNKIGVIRIRKN